MSKRSTLSVPRGSKKAKADKTGAINTILSDALYEFELLDTACITEGVDERLEGLEQSISDKALSHYATVQSLLNACSGELVVKQAQVKATVQDVAEAMEDIRRYLCKHINASEMEQLGTAAAAKLRAAAGRAGVTSKKAVHFGA